MNSGRSSVSSIAVQTVCCPAIAVNQNSSVDSCLRHKSAHCPTIDKNSHSCSIWLIDDALSVRQSAIDRFCGLSSVHIRIVHFTLAEFESQRHRAFLCERLDKDKPFVVWCRLKGIGGCTSDQHGPKRLSTLIHLCRRQNSQHRQFILESNAQNTIWRYGQLVQFGDESFVHTCYLRLCNLGVVDPQSLKPVSMLVKLLTSYDFPSSSECECGTPFDQHKRDSNKFPMSYDNANGRVPAVPVQVQQQTIFVSVLFALILACTSHAPEVGLEFHGSSLLEMVSQFVNKLTPNPFGVMSSSYKKLLITSQRFQPIEPELSPEPASSFPTESRIRQKEKQAKLKEQGIEIVKKKKVKVIEPGNDDCGEDESGIALFSSDVFTLFEEVGVCPETDPMLDLDDNFVYLLEGDLFPRGWLHGSGVEDHSLLQDRHSSFHTSNMSQFCDSWLTDNVQNTLFVDIVEICGGSAKTSQMLVRRRHRDVSYRCKNFDIVVDIDLLEPHDIDKLWHYMRKCKPLVTIHSSPCTGLAGYSSINRIVNHNSWASSREVSVPLGHLSGEIATFQLKAGRHFFSEHPAGSEMYQLRPWHMLSNDPRVVWANVDMCAAGLRGQRTGHYIKKPSELWASHELLLSPLRHFVCNGCHKHEPIEGSNSHEARSWTWQFASALASGIAALTRHVIDHKQFAHVVHQSFPAGEEERQTRRRSVRTDWECPGCYGNLSRQDPRHTRHRLQCKWPDVASSDVTCPGCVARAGRDDPRHTFDEHCMKWPEPARVSQPRTGQHPREPRRRGSDDPTAALRPAPGLESVKEEPEDKDVPIVVPGQASSSQSQASGSQAPGIDYRADDPANRPDRQTRSERSDAGVARARRDVEVQADDRGIEWSSWDLGRSLQLLRSQHPGTICRTLRVLHLRWWHASAAKMKKLLQAAGVTGKALDMVDNIVDTCKQCRMWARPGPTSKTTSRLIEEFNDTVQHDLFFIRTHPVMHLIDSCIRWTRAGFIADKESGTLMRSLYKLWLSLYGGPRVLESDQESGLITDAAKQMLQRWNTQLVQKGVNEHVRMLEKHHDILRQQFLKLEAQIKEEGLNIDSDMIMDEAVFAKNALFQVGNVSPYQCLHGRTPTVLPDHNMSDAFLDDSVGGPAGYSRGRHRVRELAVQTCIEHTAKERAQRALRSRTRSATQSESYDYGDKVDVWRSSGQKETPCWKGPATVERVDEKGDVHVKWQGGMLICRPQDIRRALAYMSLSYLIVESYQSSSTSPFSILQNYVQNLRRTTELFAIVLQDGKFQPTKCSRQHPEVYFAVLHVASCGLHLTGCIGARLGSGCKVLEGISGYDDTVIWYWNHSRPSDVKHMEETGTKRINMSTHESDTDRLRVVQFLLSDMSVVDDIRRDHPHVPHLGGPSLPDVEMLYPHPSQFPTPVDIDSELPASHSVPSGNHSSSLKRQRSEGSQGSENPAPHVSPMLDSTSSTRDESDDEEWHSAQDTEEAMYDLTVSTFYAIQPNMSLHSQSEFSLSYLLEEPTDTADFEFAFADDIAHLVSRVDCQEPWVQGALRSGCRLVLVASKNTSSPYSVIERTFDDLSPLEIKKHAQAVAEAKLVEFKRWVDLSTFVRMPRSQATNILDVTWVLKWKMIKGVRSIKSRCTARGFKDLQAKSESVHRYAATAKRTSQRAICGIAAQQRTVLFSFDISAAFLKGMTFDQIAKQTGEVLRSVQVELKEQDAITMRLVPGMEGFDPQKEVLNLVKPMWGLVDAPRAFQLELLKALAEEGLVATQFDAQCFIKPPTVKDNMVGILCTAHIDDIKGTGEQPLIDSLIACLKRYFGDDLKSTYYSFEHTGVMHEQDEKDFSVYTHQNHYVSQLKPIEPQLYSLKSDTDVCESVLLTLYQSLLGALAWLLQTRADICTYVGYLQRNAHAPTIYHVKKANRLLSWCKRCKTGIQYNRLTPPLRIVTIADSAYKGSESDCLSVRGFLIALAGTESGAHPGGSVQLWDNLSKKHTVITRSSFSSELRNALAADASTQLIRSFVHEIVFGTCSAEKLAEMQDSGRYTVPYSLCIDARSIYDAVAREGEVLTGSDPSLTMHVKSLKEKILSGQITQFIWIDNRDMAADGLTKGKAPRDALLLFSKGRWPVQHPILVFSGKNTSNNTVEEE